jgi:hypothetical protein
MKKEDMAEIATFGLVTLVIGVWLGYWIGAGLLHRKAIEQDCAFYDSKTGEFRWGNP